MGEECEGEKVESCSLGIWRQKGGDARGGFWLFCCARQRNFHIMLIISNHLLPKREIDSPVLNFVLPIHPPLIGANLHCIFLPKRRGEEKSCHVITVAREGSASSSSPTTTLPSTATKVTAQR